MIKSALSCLAYLMYGKCEDPACKLNHEAPEPKVEEVKAPAAPVKKPRDPKPRTAPAHSEKKEATSGKKSVRFEATISAPKREEVKVAKPMDRKVEKKDKPCPMFKTKGFCKYGNKCFYSHAIPKIQPVVKPALKATPKPAIEEEKKAVPQPALPSVPQEWNSFRFPGMPESKP